MKKRVNGILVDPGIFRQSLDGKPDFLCTGTNSLGARLLHRSPNRVRTCKLTQVHLICDVLSSVMLQAETRVPKRHVETRSLTGLKTTMLERGPRQMRVPRRSDTKQLQRTRQKAYIADVLDATGVSKTALGKLIGAGEGTITQFLDDDRHSGTLDGGLLQALVDWSGIPYPAIEPQVKFRGFREDAVPYQAAPPKAAKVDPIRALMGDRLNAHAWVMKVDLPGACVRQGDIVIVDGEAEPRDGDLVCCQFEEGMTATTVFRLLTEPFLMSAQTNAAAEKPELRNNTTRRIVGVVTNVVRNRVST